MKQSRRLLKRRRQMVSQSKLESTWPMGDLPVINRLDRPSPSAFFPPRRSGPSFRTQAPNATQRVASVRRTARFIQRIASQSIRHVYASSARACHGPPNAALRQLLPTSSLCSSPSSCSTHAMGSSSQRTRFPPRQRPRTWQRHVTLALADIFHGPRRLWHRYS